MTKKEIQRVVRSKENCRNGIMKSSLCGCYYCCSVLRPSDIIEWTEEENAKAICPNCGIDAVIGDGSGTDVTIEKLKEINRILF